MISKIDFKNKFLSLPCGFSTPIEFIDDTFGFSILKEHPNGYASLFKIYIRQEELKKDGPLKIIDGSVSYGKKTNDGITLSSSSEKIKKFFDPLDLLSSNEFSYNFEKDQFFYQDKEITAKAIVELLDKWHLKITRTFRGAWLRLKIIWFHYLLAKFWRVVFKIISVFQYIVTGEKIKIFHSIKDPSRSLRLDEKPLNIEESKLINLFGYMVKPWIAGFYAGVHLLIYFILYQYNCRPFWLIAIFRNNFLTLMYGIVSLGIANTFLPMLFKFIKFKGALKFIQSLYMNSAFRKVKI